MNIQELQSFNLADAAKFHYRLNPKIWDKDENLLPKVKEKLMSIAEDFREFLGIPDLDVKDITISGSNAAYSYTDKSDIDLHLIVQFPEGKQSQVYRELFDAKKFQYNELHDFKIGNYDVELYVQDVDQPHASQGIYSLLGNKWISVPRRIKADVDHAGVKHKYEDFGNRIERAIQSGDLDTQKQVLKRLKDMRQTGLEQHGEFGAENLAFKMLRNTGLIQDLWNAYYKAKSEKLSLDEKRKEKFKKPFVYGYTEDASHTPDGVSASTTMDLNETDVEEDASHTPDGVSASTTMTLNENNPEDVLNKFMKFCVEKLKIKNDPVLKLRRDPQWPKVNKTFGRFNPETGVLEVAWGKRHLMDVLRTVAHELTHQRQFERDDMPSDAGETGSEYENEANARAGILMRVWGQEHPELFDTDMISDDLDEGSLKNAAAALALGTTLGLGSPAVQGQSVGDAIKTVQNIGTAVKTARGMTRAGINAEISQELFNYIRAQGGDPHGQNQSTLYQWQKRMEQDRRAREQDSQPASTEYIGDFRTDNSKPARARRMPDSGRGEGYIIGDSVQESASGYIPKKKEAKDPRYSMALTVDIKPGQIGKEANKLKLKTDSQGHPQIAKPNGLFENLMMEYQKYKAQEDYSPDNPPGPEFKPTMPAGTLRVDVSDVYDWYKIGQHISNMKGLGKHDFGQGPPSSIISFGDEDTEHKFIKDLEATGLDVTDIDPLDPKKRIGKQIKTDPTYNVNESELDEVKMSPSALRKFAQSDAAKGMLAGFELEVCIPDTNSEDDDDYDMEPDYDMDERVYSVDGIIDFFTGGDYSDLSERSADRLRDQLYDEYNEALMEQANEDWGGDDGLSFYEEYVRDQWNSGDEWSNRVREYLEDQDTGDLLGDRDEIQKRIDDVIKAGKSAPRFMKSSEQEEYISKNPDYRVWLEADEYVEEQLQEYVEQTWNNREGDYYDDARTAFEEQFSDAYEFETWASDTGNRWMSDVANNYNLNWPYMTGGHNGGENTIEDRATQLSRALGMPVKASSNYHSARRTNDSFILEPDSSIETDNREDAGLELISPPLPIDQCLEKLKAAIEWCQENNCYTNNSTGLHMGVSLPSQSTKDLDYVKLALFLGDEYVLKDFEREANTYTRSVLKDIKSKAKTRSEQDITKVLSDMRDGLSAVASKIIADTSPGKYSSINVKDNYVEFRSAGGDTLSRESREGTDFLENTLYRYVQAMAIAGDPEAEKKEYAKKLYKMIAPEGGSQSLALFAKYAAGDIDKETLKQKWAETTLSKEMPDVPTSYELVNKATGERAWYRNDITRREAEQETIEQFGRRNIDQYTLRKMAAPPEFEEYEFYNIDTDEVIDKVKAKSREEAFDYFNDLHKNRPDITKMGVQKAKSTNRDVVEPPPKLSRRGELAQRIKSTKKREPQPEDNIPGEWEFFNRQSGSVLNRVNDANYSQAETARKDTAKKRNLDDDLVGMRRVEQKKYSSYADAQRAADQQNNTPF